MAAADIESALAQGGGCDGADGVMIIDDDGSTTNLQTTVILNDPTTHIVAPEHQTRSKHHNKNDPPIECV